MLTLSTACPLNCLTCQQDESGIMECIDCGSGYTRDQTKQWCLGIYTENILITMSFCMNTR